jgi:hypothetical protein
MPPSKGPLWKFFYAGEKQNTAQHKAYCLGCVFYHSLTNSTPQTDKPNIPKIKDKQWFKDGMCSPQLSLSYYLNFFQLEKVDGQ